MNHYYFFFSFYTITSLKQKRKKCDIYFVQVLILLLTCYYDSLFIPFSRITIMNYNMLKPSVSKRLRGTDRVPFFLTLSDATESLVDRKTVDEKIGQIYVFEFFFSFSLRFVFFFIAFLFFFIKVLFLKLAAKTSTIGIDSNSCAKVRLNRNICSCQKYLRLRVH